MSDLDFTGYLDFHLEPQERTILSCVFRLDKKTIIKALGSESIVVDGVHYEVPEEQLVDLLKNKTHGEIRIELTKIK